MPYPNNRVELRYFSDERRSERLSGGVPPWNWLGLKPLLGDLDALYVNLISGFELELETAQLIRQHYRRADLLRSALAHAERAAHGISRAAPTRERRRVVRVLRSAAGERGRARADGAGPDGARRDGILERHSIVSSSRSGVAASCTLPHRVSMPSSDLSRQPLGIGTGDRSGANRARARRSGPRHGSMPAIRLDAAMSGARPISPGCLPVISCPTRCARRCAPQHATWSTGVPPGSRITSAESSARRDHRHQRSALARRRDDRAGPGSGGPAPARSEGAHRRPPHAVGVAVRPHDAADDRADTRRARRRSRARRTTTPRPTGRARGSTSTPSRSSSLHGHVPRAPERRRVERAARDHARRQERRRPRRGRAHSAEGAGHSRERAASRPTGDDALRDDALRSVSEHRRARAARRLGRRADVHVATATRTTRGADRRLRRWHRISRIARERARSSHERSMG